MNSRCNFKKLDGKLCKLKTSEKFCTAHSKECSICCDKLYTEKTKKLECKHIFHKKCLDEWLERDNRCPLCRNDIQQHSFKVAISNNPLLVDMNVKFFLEKLQILEHQGKFNGNKLSIDVVDKNTAGVFNFHTKELLGTFKLN